MFKGIQKSILIALTVLAVASCAGTGEKEPVTSSEFLLGTTCVITILDWEKEADPQDAITLAFEKIQSMENLLSVNIDTSDISSINRSGLSGFTPDPMVLDVLNQALDIAGFSDGRFDPSIGRLVALWGIGTDHAAVPEEKDLEEALSTIDYKKIEISDTGRVSLLNPGASLDLGGIAKGYAADIVRDSLRSSGIRSAIINLGGNVLVMGKKASGDPWRIGIQDPREPRGEYLGIIEVSEKAIVTSGVYERFFVEDGVHYHHILDTETGYPVQNGVISTSIIHARSVQADGLSTALFALGVEEGMTLANTLEDTGVIMIDENNRVYITDNLKDSFQLNSGSGYTLAGDQD